MRIAYGGTYLDVKVPPERVAAVRPQPVAPALTDPALAVRTALEQPFAFPPLRRALTPDDHVAIVVDERIPHLARLLTPILEHITKALIPPESMTIVCAPSPTEQTWIDELPDAFQDVRVEMHDANDRHHLSYLAATKQGRRIYLNRTAVDADQLVVLTRRSYDPLLGYSGGEGAIYPALSDEGTIRACWQRRSLALPSEKTAWPFREEAIEVAWLLGAPFFVQIVSGADDSVAHVVGGSLESCAEGQRLLDARWRAEVDHPCDTVVLGVAGQPTFAALASALACGTRIVKPQGRMVLLTQGELQLGAAADLLCRADDAGAALSLLREHHCPDGVSAFEWASAADQATIYLLSDLPGHVAEDLLTVPLSDASQVQRLLREGTCVFLDDADKTLALVASARR